MQQSNTKSTAVGHWDDWAAAAGRNPVNVFKPNGASDPRTINGSAKVDGEARAALRDVGVEGLIAQPAH